MKISQLVVVSSLIGVADTAPLQGLFKRDDSAAAGAAPAAALAAVADHENLTDETRRALQSGTGCYGSGTLPDAQWHPQYSMGWSEGFCRFTVDCDSPGYSTELACCKAAYRGQMSGRCLMQLPNPPTTSPTGSGGLDIYYPDYDTAWSEAGCINEMPMPSGRPTYDTMLACCKGAYGGQMSGKCLAALPNPPTTSPTESGGLDVWYPDPSEPWSDGHCINDRPFPNNVGQPFDTMLDCCKRAYRGQVSGACLASLPNPPTTSPTGAGGLDYFYPDYATAWSEATCKNERPLPFNPGDRPTYDTMLECCKGAYGGQTSGKCLAELPSPPTTSPTGSGGLDVYYPDPDTPWSDATCINDRPFPNNVGAGYDSVLQCCKSHFRGQVSGKCLAALPSPPTTSPTGSGGLDIWYPERGNWSGGKCINDRPFPNNVGQGYSSQQLCCSGAFAGQTNHACQCDADPCYSCECSGTGSWQDGKSSTVVNEVTRYTGANCPNLKSGTYYNCY